MKFILILFLIFPIAGVQIATAQTPRIIPLNEAISLSIQNSKQLKLNRAQQQEAASSVKTALDRRLPDASATGSYLRVAQPHITLKTGKDSAGSNSNSTPKVSQALYGIVNITYPLYAGGRIKYGIESARYLEKAVELDGENDKEELVLNTMNAYTNLYKARAAVNLVNENLQQSNSRVKDFTNLEKNGLLARNDLLKAQLQTSNIELSLLDAESNKKIATVNMNIMLGLPEDTELIPDSASMHASVQLKTIDEYERLALQNRKDIEALSFRQKAATTNIKSTAAQSYPSIALTGGYVSAYIPNFVTLTNALNIGLGVQYNISSLWKNGTLNEAKARERQLAASSEQLNDAIRLQINQAYQNYLVSVKKIEVYGKAVEQAAENYKISNNKYANSLLTTTDLLDADVVQLQAKLNYSFARADAILAYNKLLQVTGLLRTR